MMFGVSPSTACLPKAFTLLLLLSVVLLLPAIGKLVDCGDQLLK